MFFIVHPLAFYIIKIYSVGVWNLARAEREKQEAIELKFTPLEFETSLDRNFFVVMFSY